MPPKMIMDGMVDRRVIDKHDINPLAAIFKMGDNFSLMFEGNQNLLLEYLVKEVDEENEQHILQLTMPWGKTYEIVNTTDEKYVKEKIDYYEELIKNRPGTLRFDGDRVIIYG